MASEPSGLKWDLNRQADEIERLQVTSRTRTPLGNSG